MLLLPLVAGAANKGGRGFLFILVILFCLVDPESVLSDPSNMPIVAMVLQATGSRGASTFISLMLAVCFINGCNASITSVSRLLFSVARDRGIIFHHFFEQIAPNLNVPLHSIMLCYVFNICFGLLYLGPTVAFSAYVASLVILLNITYAAPTLILLLRGRKLLALHQKDGIFRMGPLVGPVVNTVSVLYLVITSIVSVPDGLSGRCEWN